MRKTLVIAVVTVGLTWLAFAPAAPAATHSIGLGANYWKTLNDIDVKDNIDESGLSWLASYQYAPEGIVKLELDLEHYPKLGGGAERKAFWSPEAFVLVGGTLYGGAGVGWYYDGDVFSDSPFFMLRAGIDFAILPFLSLDINANYRFNNWHKGVADDIDTDTVRLGAALRFSM